MKAGIMAPLNSLLPNRTTILFEPALIPRLLSFIIAFLEEEEKEAGSLSWS